MCIDPLDICKSLAYTNANSWQMAHTSSQIDKIRKAGLRVTPARVAVIDVFHEVSRPLDVSEVLSHLRKRNLDTDQATIYRIVDNFYQRGVLERLQFHDKKFRYEVKTNEHHHAICTNCGTIEDVSNCSIDVLEEQIKKTKGFTVKNHSLEFFGLCKNCLI